MARTRDEHGVIAITVALITCFVLIPVAALAVDIGVQRVARTDMQSLADVVALDLARKLDGATTMTQWTSASPSLQERADRSRDQNTATVGQRPGVTPTLGTLSATGVFTPLPTMSDQVPDAVRVEATTSVRFNLMPGSGGATRAAVAQADTSACFQLGSFAATLDPSASALFRDLLTPLIGSSALSAVGYNGLATADLSLLELVRADQIGVGTVSELLALTDLSVADVYHASASVLRSHGKVAEANVFDLAASSAVASIVIDAGDLVGLSTASDAALATRFNALDLLVGTALLANGENLLDIANLQTSLASVGVTSSQLRVIERPQRACDHGEAQTAQVRLASQAKVSIPSNPVYNSGGSVLRLTDNHINLGLGVDIAGARGRLTSVACDPDVFDVDVWTDLATAHLEGRSHIEGTVGVPKASLAPYLLPAVLLLLPNVVDIAVAFDAVTSSDASRPANATPAHATLPIPPRSYGDHVEVGSGPFSLPHVSVGIDQTTVTTSVSVAGVDLSPLTTAVRRSLVDPTLQQSLPVLTSRISPLVDPLVDKVNTLVGQLSTGLGLNVAGADMYGLPAPECQSPVLRG